MVYFYVVATYKAEEVVVTNSNTVIDRWRNTK